VYVQASQCVGDAPPLQVSNTAAVHAAHRVLRTGTVGAGAPLLRACLLHASCNECAPSDGIRTLRRFEFIDGGTRNVPLAEGVEQFQVEYAFDTNDDGSPEQFLTTISGGTTPTSRWSNVVALRLHLLLRSTESAGDINTSPAVYDLGPGHAAATCPLSFKCRALSTTLRLNNVAGRRES
jgi:type IV pilus assembly protein PilW